MKLLLQRTYFKDATLGYLSIIGQDDPVFATIERPWLDNKNNISCIPEGTYEVRPFSGTRPSTVNVWQLMDVPNRTGILIHPANYASQLQGCIAPGLASGYMFNGEVNKLVKAVTSSNNAIRQLKELTKYPEELEIMITGK